jgi:hypothetical protein
LFVFALVGSSTTALLCDWVCAHAHADTAHAAGHSHSDEDGGVDVGVGIGIGAGGHACTHVTANVVAIRASFGGNQAVAMPLAIASSIFRVASLASLGLATDAGPPILARSLASGSVLPLRI